ncbi:small-subunit processome [Dichotomocladium elegans]|nr:small-subunit processome [Dichotomocladium elegans]
MPPQRKRKTNDDKKDKAMPKKPGHKGMNKKKSKVDITDIYEASDDERELNRKGHALDEVDNYEYHVDHVEEEDDEEIDSDEAFDESDDERFESFRFQGSTKSADKKKNKKDTDTEKDIMLSEQEIDMNEDEEESATEDDEEDGEGFMDLSEMLSGDEGSEKPIKSSSSMAKKLLQGAFESEDEDENAIADFMSDDDEDNEADHDADVAKFIDSLETKKRKRDDDGSREKKQRKEERTEVYEENEFNLLARSDTSGENKKKLDLDDLMGSMANENAFASLRKTVLELDGKGKNVTKVALSAPVAKRIQDRADRQMAYKEAKKEITKWEPTVTKNRQAEHLSFPLQPPAVSEGVTRGGLSSKFSAQTPMEKQIEEALEAAGMKDKELEEFEALQLNKLSVEEIAQRRKELQMMRELMFRHELKARRLKKIKSKSYRKLQRKEKEKQQLLAAGLGHHIDEDMTPEDQMKAALERAEERMSLKHKNTSKWAKRALARGQMDEGTREAIVDQLRRGEELRKKVQGINSDDSDSDASDSDDGNDTIQREIQNLERDMETDDTQPKKGLFSMKFMQDAEKRNMNATRAMLDDFKSEWLDEEDKPKDPAEDHIIKNNPGRLAFGGPTASASGEKLSATTVASDKKVVLNDAGQIKKVSHSAAHTTRTSGVVDMKARSELDSELAEAGDEGISPWLQQVESRIKGKKASKKNNTSKGKIDDKAELSIAKIKKAQKEEGDDVELDLNMTLPILGKKGAKVEKQKANNKTVSTASDKSLTVTAAAMDSDSEGDDEDAVGMVHASSKLAFAQRDLVARAFANDNVTQEFEEEKEAVVERDADKTEDLTLPGWGNWGGKGTKKKKNKVVRKIEGIDPSKRKDAKLKHVIINEKRNKKTEKYQVTAVPYPYQNMEQYERAMRTPVGKEWNTRNTFQKMTKPKVLTKLGTVIDPLHAPFK